MASLRVKGLTTHLQGEPGSVNDISMDVADAECFVLTGYEGCGKTTVLRIIAGLEKTASGEIYMGETYVNGKLPKERDVAMVFHNYAVFPGMSVRDNLISGLRRRKILEEETNKRIQEMGNRLGINHLMRKDDEQLSCEEKWHVAVARAIICKPKLLLFDRVFTNMDASVKARLQVVLGKLLKELDLTMLYAASDWNEAMTIGDRIGLMEDGMLQQVGTALELYEQPANKFVAGFTGDCPMNFFEGKLVEKDGSVYFDQGKFEIKVEDNAASDVRDYIGQEIILGVRPEDIYDKLFVGHHSIENTIKGKVESVKPAGHDVLLTLDMGEDNLIARVDAHTQGVVGSELEVAVDASKSHFFDKDSEERVV